MKNELIAQAEAIAVEVQFMRDTATALDAANLPEGAAAVRNTAIAVERHADALRAQAAEQPAEQAVAWAAVYKGTQKFFSEPTTWKAAVESTVMNTPVDLEIASLCFNPDPQVAVLRALLVEVLEAMEWVRDNGHTNTLRGRIAAALNASQTERK